MEPKRVQDLTLESMVCGRKMWTWCNEALDTVVPSSGCVTLGNLLELCCCGSYSFKINEGTSMGPAYFCHWYKIKPYIYWLEWRSIVKILFKIRTCPGWCGSVGWAFSRKPKHHRFDSRMGHRPGLWEWSPVRACARGNRLMFFSHIIVSLPLFLPSFSSLQNQ